MSNLLRCLIVDDVDPALFPFLEQASIQYDYKPEWTVAQCIEALPQYHGLIIRSRFKVDKQIIDRCKLLQFIARAGAGVDNIDKDALTDRNIVLFHASEGNRIAVGEHTVGVILSLLNNIVSADKEVRKQIWKREENRGYELASMTVGIIGYGNMGKETAKRLAPFGCKIIVYDKYKENYSNKFAKQVSLETIQKQSDIISLHIPLNEFSMGWINAAFIAQVYKPFWLINTARGEIVLLKDLVQGLTEGKIRGAALDVLENEKLATLTPEQLTSFNALTKFDNVILTPHIAGWTYESYKKISTVLGQKILDWTRNFPDQQISTL
ncbi:MAG: phosphoglycerate dehydrogenase [Cytophagales bacterium]|nr:phosphoglycerate dehydrogenase [Cytophaga sp.]